MHNYKIQFTKEQLWELNTLSVKIPDLLALYKENLISREDVLRHLKELYPGLTEKV